MQSIWAADAVDGIMIAALRALLMYIMIAELIQWIAAIDIPQPGCMGYVTYVQT